MDLEARLGAIDRHIGLLEAAAAGGASLGEVLEPATQLVSETMSAYIEAAGAKPSPPAGTDVLETWKLLVKGDPTWNAVRDSCRELVYYGNCLASAREDALPAEPARMAVRLARHIYLYVRVRCAREGRVSA
jgi:hypothetical protein